MSEKTLRVQHVPPEDRPDLDEELSIKIELGEEAIFQTPEAAHGFARQLLSFTGRKAN